MFLVPVIETLLGLSTVGFRPRLFARLTPNVPSQAGREDWVAARFFSMPDVYHVDPIFSKSNLIFSLVRTNCMLRVPADATGLSAGEVVEVRILPESSKLFRMGDAIAYQIQ
jgi:molybdopterin molybdotransferase